MKISINVPSDLKQSGFQDSIIGRITQTLARFSNRVASVNVTLTDENGPRGGIDKQCRVRIVMPGFRQLTTSAQHENPLAAVGRAADRARRIVLTKLKRPKALRMRNRNDRSEYFSPQPDEALEI